MIRIYSFTECGSGIEYQGKAGYTCEPEYSKEDLVQIFFVDQLLIFFTYSFSVLTLIDIYITEFENN